VNYRPFTEGDFAQLYAIEEVCFQPPFRFGRGYMRRLVNSTDAATWIAEEDGRMDGFAIVEWMGEDAYIPTIEVMPERRGLGIAGELLRRIEGAARDAGAKTIRLHVDAENAGAIRLYEGHAYACQGREENFYPKGRAALVYGKALEGHSV
jgi:ribosomal-protein-alanine N-acetyltransferase